MTGETVDLDAFKKVLGKITNDLKGNVADAATSLAKRTAENVAMKALAATGAGTAITGAVGTVTGFFTGKAVNAAGGA